MRTMRILTTGCLFLLSAAAQAARADVAADADLAGAVRGLSAAVERLSALLQADAASRVEDREARRIETANSILGLRIRKIERLESEIDGLAREDYEESDAARRLRERIDAIGKEFRAESGALPPEARREVAEIEAAIRRSEERAARAAERRNLLEANLVAERRRLADLERIVDAWVEALR